VAHLSLSHASFTSLQNGWLAHASADTPPIVTDSPKETPSPHKTEAESSPAVDDPPAHPANKPKLTLSQVVSSKLLGHKLKSSPSGSETDKAAETSPAAAEISEETKKEIEIARQLAAEKREKEERIKATLSISVALAEPQGGHPYYEVILPPLFLSVPFFNCVLIPPDPHHVPHTPLSV
jgi:hypothetical protein